MAIVYDFGQYVKPVTLFDAFGAAFDQACAELNTVDLNIARLKRHVAARFIRRSYPQAAYISHAEALRISQPIAQPHLVVTRPNGYTVHAVVDGRIANVVEAINFEVRHAA